MISEITKSRNKSDALMEVLVFVLNLLISTFILSMTGLTTHILLHKKFHLITETCLLSGTGAVHVQLKVVGAAGWLQPQSRLDVLLFQQQVGTLSLETSKREHEMAKARVEEIDI